MTSSLQTTEDASAAVAVAPRISKKYIESQIEHCMFVTGDALVASAICPTSVTEPPWARSNVCGILADAVQPEYDHHTVCLIRTRAGFTVVGHSAPASRDNFNAELGRQFAYENAFRQLWPLFAFTLLEMNAYQGDGVEWMNAAAAASPNPDGFQ